MKFLSPFVLSLPLLRLSSVIPALWLFACSGAEEHPSEEFSDSARPIELTEDQLEAIEELENIGYIGGGESTLDERMVGVLKHEPDRVQPGLNLFSSGHGPVAILMDMEGRELHQWETTFVRAFPEARPPTEEELEINSRHQSFRRVYVFPGGELLAIFEGAGMVKLDWNSNIVWSREMRCHHDLQVMPDGRIYTLVAKSGLFPRIHPAQPVKLDFVAVLDPKGREIERYPIYEAYENSPFADQLEPRFPVGDIMHTNALTVFDGALDHLSPIYGAGNVLISIREMSSVGILNPREGRMVWAQRGPWKYQHEPQLLDDGSILVFDNAGGPSDRQLSRILKVDPLSGQTTVVYGEGEGEGFVCGHLGAVSGLENGNTLITHSLAGLVFEVTPERQTVWEFQTPYHWGKYGEKVAVIFQLIRVPEDYFDAGLLEE